MLPLFVSLYFSHSSSVGVMGFPACVFLIGSLSGIGNVLGLSGISATIRERHLRFSGHCWRSKNEVVSDLVLWEPKRGKMTIEEQIRTFVDLLDADTGVPRDCLPAVMDDRVGWRKKAMGG